MRIFIACADERLRLALHLLLDHQPGMVVVGLSDRLPGLLAQLEGSQPDLLLLDWELADESMGDLLTHLHSLEHQPRTIVLAARPEAKEAVLAAGADFFLCKDSPPDTLLPILRGMQQSEPDA